MINNDNLYKLYDGVLEGEELTTKQLNSYGFTSNDITKMINDGSIERVKRGFYSLESVGQLFNYGMKLLIDKEYEKANLCFEKCYELDPEYHGIHFRLLINNIQEENYSRVFEIYDSLLQTENKFYVQDFKFYLYLLSIITEVPEKYREYVKDLQFEDIKIFPNDKRYKNVLLYNKLRRYALYGKYSYAFSQLNDLVAKQGKCAIYDKITRILLYRAKMVEKESKETVIQLIKEKDYYEVQNYLRSKQHKHKLTRKEEYILKLVEQFIRIKESSQIPLKGELKDIYKALDANDYSLALKLNKEHNEKYNIFDDPFDPLLNDICQLITTLENRQVVDVSSKTDPVADFSKVISFFKKNDLDNAFHSLKSYMESIEKTDYEFLIIDLIKLSLLKQDNTFGNVMSTLELIGKDNYLFDMSSYIQQFYVALSQKEFYEARIYLDIISKGNQLMKDSINTDGLYQRLEFLEKGMDYKELSSESVVVEEVIDDDSKKREENVVVPVKQEINQEKKLISQKYKELVKNKGIILLEIMNNDKNDRIIDIVEEYPDMDAFVIGNGSKQQVVLRYKPLEKGYVDFHNLLVLGNYAYKNKDYKRCIENYLELLQVVKEPKSFVYSKLGLAYLKLHNKERAIDYFTVAVAKADEEKNIREDFSDLLLLLKGEISKEDLKPFFRMTKNDFDYSDVNNYYGINDFDKINTYISESGLDVESACCKLGMTPEQINTIKLIYAREFYIRGDFHKGDSFIQSVEKSKEKTKKTISLFDEVRRSRKYYQYRKLDTPRQLNLSLQPTKK